MATDSFRFWDSYYEALKMAPTPEDGYRLIMALCAQVFDGEEPDFSDSPILGMAYQIMAGQAIQSRDISRRARENGAKGRGVKKGSKSTAKAPLKGGLRGAKANRSEEKRSDYSNESRLRDSLRDAPGADAPAPAPEPWDSGDYPPPPPPPSP